MYTTFLFCIRGAFSSKSYQSIDPAPPLNLHNIDDIGEIILNENLSFFARYAAIFCARDIGSKESIMVLFNIVFVYLYYIENNRGS